MEKLKKEHMEAVGEIAASAVVNQIIETLGDCINDLPDEFNDAKDSFKKLEFDFNQGLNKTVDKYV